MSTTPSTFSNSLRDVLARLDLDDPVAPALGAHDREAPAGVLRDLEVGAAATATERAEELADEALALQPTDAGDHRETRVEADGHGVRPRLQDQPLVAHVSAYRRGPFFS